MTLRCHYNVVSADIILPNTTMSLQCHYDVVSADIILPNTTMSLRCHYVVTTMSLQCCFCWYHSAKHYNVTTMSLWCHYDVTEMSLRCHYNVTTMSLRCHYHVTTMSLQIHDRKLRELRISQFSLFCSQFSQFCVFRFLSAYGLCQKKSTNIDPNFHDSSATELRATQSHVIDTRDCLLIAASCNDVDVNSEKLLPERVSILNKKAVWEFWVSKKSAP